MKRYKIPWVSKGISFAFLGVLLAAACNQNMQPLPESGEVPPPRMRSQTPGAVPAGGMHEGGSARIAGRISMAPELADRLTGAEVLFIMARRGGGPPLAVKRIASPKFPVNYALTREDQMVQGAPFTGIVEVVARLDRDGNAGPPQPGDMEGDKTQVTIGDTDVNIVINRIY